MRLRCYLRDVRGKRSQSEIAAAAEGAVSRGILSQIERGIMLPTDEQVPALERAYGRPFQEWYHPAVLRVLELDPEEDGHGG